jgi:flavorubredoxin/flavin reductase (DIM6/NTAB) family NADH-FMN oxidoreductase RutF
MWEGLTPGKQYQLKTVTAGVADDTTTIRSMDLDRDRFDIEFSLTHGTTYNSYIIRGDKVAIVDASHEKFEDLYFEALDKQVDYGTVSYLIVSHTEPDHSGLVPRILDKCAAAGNESIVVVGSKVCIQFLQNLCFTPFKSQVVANGAKIDLGKGHELEFVIAPNLHWPDTMFTFDHGTKFLYTCDAFGMHYCSQHITDVEGVKELLPHYALYYDCLMKPNARSVLTALKKTAGLDFHTIATGHGPMLVENTQEWVDMYKSWSDKATQKLGPSVAIFWVSSYGQSERLAQIFAHGVTSTSAVVEMHDLNAIDIHDITECMARNEIIAVMTPQKGDNAAAANLSSIIASAKEKKHKFTVLESAGPEQEPAEIIRQRFASQQIPEAAPAMIAAQDAVTPQVMQGFEEQGMKLGQLLTQAQKLDKARKKDKDLERALGRMSSSLYIVTAVKAGVRHAMVASWVTAASKSPLGISLTIAKDRAMEPLLRVGDQFNVNFLEEGRSLKMMKHFLKKFPAGVDRLEGIDAIASPGTGAAVLREACAYLECRIVSRMDASDHWVAYAHVIGGTVSKKEAVVATHRRKVATYY